MPGICVSISDTDGALIHDATVTFPDCGERLPLLVGGADGAATTDASQAFLDALFVTEPETFAAVFAATFSLPILLYLVAWGYQSVVTFATTDRDMY